MKAFVLVDGDDYQAHPNVLQKLADIYKECGYWMTHGSYRGSESYGKDPICQGYSPGDFGKVKWRVHFQDL